MDIFVDNKKVVEKESELISDIIELKGSRVIELGCGSGGFAIEASKRLGVKKYIGCEVDVCQHRNNLLGTVQSGVEFVYAGAENIPFPDDFFDYVFMFKSLHHVPVGAMPRALSEIARVLKSGGVAWISEPVYKGDFNDLVKIFNDERVVRGKAFEAVCDAVEKKIFNLRQQVFFHLKREFSSFVDFETKVVNVTHSDNSMSDESYTLLREIYSKFSDCTGRTEFLAPMRVDVLEKL